MLNYNVTWSPRTLIERQLCKITPWWVRDLMFVNEKRKKKESFAAFICHQLYLHNPGGISESNASGQHLPGEQRAPTVHISLGRRPSLSVIRVPFSTTKWQFITWYPCGLKEHSYQISFSGTRLYDYIIWSDLAHFSYFYWIKYQSNYCL